MTVPEVASDINITLVGATLTGFNAASQPLRLLASPATLDPKSVKVLFDGFVQPEATFTEMSAYVDLPQGLVEVAGKPIRQLGLLAVDTAGQYVEATFSLAIGARQLAVQVRAAQLLLH